jgi:NACalpha-BTF3-like transcription factor
VLALNEREITMKHTSKTKLIISSPDVFLWMNDGVVETFSIHNMKRNIFDKIKGDERKERRRDDKDAPTFWTKRDANDNRFFTFEPPKVKRASKAKKAAQS